MNKGQETNLRFQAKIKEERGMRKANGKDMSCSCGSVVEHCVSNTKGCGFNFQGIHILIKKKE